MSNIATTIEQSKHLLELGLDQSTADCHYKDIGNVGEHYKLEVGGLVGNNDIPAWSLDRMAELICFNDNAEVRFRSMGNGSIWFCCFTLNEDGGENGFSRMSNTKVNAAYEVFEYLLDAGYIKKGGEE